MAGTKLVRFSIKGLKGSERILPVDEFRQYIANLSDSAKARVKLEGTHDSVYENTEGDLVRETLSGDQVMARAQLGEDALITKGSDPKLEAYRQQQHARARKETAADENALAVLHGINPWRVTGLPQKLEEMAVGKEAAIQADNEIAAANHAETLFGNMALGFMAGGAATGVLTKLGMGADMGAKALIANVVADEAAFDTTLYTKYIMDQRKDFQAEELGSMIVAGLVISAPLVGAALLRRPAWELAKNVGSHAAGGIGHLAGTARNALVLRGLAAGAKGGKYNRAAAGMGVLNRILGGRKAVTKIDELAEMQKVMAKEELAIGRATPEGLRAAKGGKAEDILEAVRANMDQAANYLDGIDANGMASDLKGVRTATRQASNAVYRTSRNMKVGAPKGIGRLGKSAEGRLESAMDNFLGWADDMGFGDEIGHLRDVTSSKEYGRLFQARLDLALKGKVGNRATKGLDEALRTITEDTTIWGTGKALEQARNLNKGIDRLSDGFSELRRLDIPDDLSKIPDGTDLTALDHAIGEVRGGLDHLHASGLLDFNQLRGITNTLDRVEDALVTGKVAYVDAVKLNKARKSAAINHKARFEKVKAGDVETAGALEARMEGRADEIAHRFKQFVDFGDMLIRSGKIPLYVNRSLRILKETPMEEKQHMFMQMQEKIPMLVGNPEHLAQELQPFLSQEPQSIEVHNMAGVQSTQALYFLANKLGRVDRTLYGKNRPPNREKAQRFAETFAAMVDPIDVAYAATTGEVTQDMIDSVRVTRPSMYAELSVLLSQLLDKMDPITTPRATYKGVTKFLGGGDPISSGEVIMQLQSNYAQNEQQAQAVGGSPNGHFHQEHPQDGDNAFTFTQRLQSY